MIIDKELTETLIDAELVVMEARIGLAQHVGYTDAAVHRWGGMRLLLHPAQPKRAFLNRLHGIRAGMGHEIHEALATMRAAGVKPRAHLTPLLYDQGSLDALRAEGLSVAGFDAVWVMDPDEIGPAPVTDAEIYEVETPATREAFTRIYGAGYKIPLAENARLCAAMVEQTGWRFYVAFIDGEPAAQAVLDVHGKVGHIVESCTLPRFRGRGCQSALLHQRALAAREAGCTWLTSQTEPGSTSARNMQRFGFRLAYLDAILTGE